MKTVVVLIGVLILIACSLSSFAIEGIQVSVQSSNVVLSWPSLTNETYIAQYRHTLSSTDVWVTLTNYYPATLGTNITSFIHSNSVDFGMPGSGGGTNGGGGSLSPNGTNTYSGPAGTNGAAGTGFYRVVRDGVHMWGITNGMVISNVLVTSIEFSVDSTDEIIGVSFYDTNDNPIIGASAQQLGSNEWLLVWNTTMSYNGDYTFNAELDFASDEPVVSQPVTVTVNNTISFPNYFSQVFGDQMWIYAATIPDASYELDMYDENTNYLGSFNGAADDSGTISFTWDLTDGSGDTFDSTNFYGVFTVDTSGLPDIRSKVVAKPAGTANFQSASTAKKTLSTKIKTSGVHPNDSGSSASAKQMWVQEGRWTPNNNWVLAYAPLTDPATDPNTSAKESLMMLGGSDDEDLGPIGALDPHGAQSNLSPGNFPETSAFELADASSRANLLRYLASSSPQYENFYYFGHGNSSVISAYNGAGSAITGTQIAYALGNVPLSYPNPNSAYDNSSFPASFSPTVNPSIQRVALHPYRFVFLDGCNTGAGNLCESFGIPAITVSTNFFATAGVESRAFIGFTNEKSFNTATWDSYSLMIGGFFEDWLSNALSVSYCIGNAQNGVYESIVEMDSSAVVFGATDMLRNTRTRP